MAKRVNKRFLVILTTVVLVGGVAGMAAMLLLQKLNKKDPQLLIQESARLEKEGNYEGAIAQLQGAVGARQQDPALRVQLGDLFNRAVVADPQNYPKARQTWESALSIDPAYKPALQRILDSTWAFMEAVPQQPTSYRSVREAAARLLAVDPQDRTAQARTHITTIRQAEANVPTKVEEIDKSVKALWELAVKDPADAEPPYWAVRGEIRIAQETAKQLTDLPEARAMVAKMVPSIQQMLKGQEKNSEMQLRAAQLFSSMSQVERMVGDDSTTNPTTFPTRGKPAGKYTDQVTASLAAARENAKPTDKEFVEIYLQNVQWLKVCDRGDEARKLLDQLAELRGDDPVVRLAYAREFRSVPDRRAKVMEMLARPVSMDGVEGVDALTRIDLKTSMSLELSTMRLASLDTERDPAKRKEVIDAVTADVKKIEAAGGAESMGLLALKGRLMVIQGKLPEAVRLLQQSLDKDKRGPEYQDIETMLLLASTYSQTGQTGQSEKLLRQVVSRAPDYTQGRILWISVLMNNGQVNEAREQLAELKARSPNSPEIPGLQALVEGGKAREEFVEKLPENTPPERVRKAIGLRGEGKLDEAIALAEAAFKADPKYLPALEQLIELYVATDRHDDAVAAAQTAIKANPENTQLQGLPDKLVKRTPEEIDKWRLEQIGKETDPVLRELRFFEFYLQKSNAAAARQNTEEEKKNAAEAETHLAAAEKLKPGDVRVDSRRFEFLLRQGRFDEAGGPLLQKLVAANSDEVNGQLLRYRLAMAKKDLGAAEAAARDITRQRAPFALGWQLLGSVMHAQARYPEALEAYNAAIERQGKNYEALKGLIAVYYDMDDIAQAKATLDRARQAFPNDLALRDAYLNHELTYGDPANAIAEREKQFKANPEVAGNALALAQTYLQAVSLETDPKKVQTTIEKVRTLLEAGIKKWPNDQRFQWPLAQVRLRQDDFIGGEAILKQYAAQPDADKVQANLFLAEYYAQANKPNMAEEVLREAVKQSNGSAGAKLRLANFLAATNRPAEALKEIEGLPGPAVAKQRAQLLIATGKADEALKVVEEALAGNPTATDLANLQLDLLISSGRFADADKLVQQRLAKSDRDEAARYSSAVIKLRKQPADVAGAIGELNKLVERSPRNVQVRALMADAHVAAGDPAAAIDDLVRAVELAPLVRDYRTKLIELAGGQRRWDIVRKYASDAMKNPRLAQDPVWPRSLALAAAGSGQFAEAEKQILAAISMVPPDKAIDLQREHLAILVQSKNYPKALKLTDDWIAQGRKDWWIYQFRGVSKTAQKDRTASKEFDTALAAINPEEQPAVAELIVRSIATSLSVDEALKRIEKWEATQPNWRIVAAELCMSKSDSAAALAHLEPLGSQIDKLPPPVVLAYHRLTAVANYTLKPKPDLAKSAAAYEKYLALAPNDVLSLNNLAYLLAEEIQPPRPQDAKIYSKKAYDIARTWKAGDAKCRILDTHGWVLVLNQGAAVDEGIRVLEEAIEEFPIIEARYHLGEAQLIKKRGEEAETQLAAALAMIDKAKKDKTPFDTSLEPRVQKALEQAKAMNASAGAG